ncbi:MAG TPA: UDP-N-acetylglucosamine 1-carboxyvinyltransferase [Anaerolineales bacterium]|nr:UDP-N-acetylglucosamine 1-carboxyvinyltransferase [Anaerolineales bacterium]
MPAFRIEGGRPLQGMVRASGNKNAALPLMTACLMTEEPVVLHNVPDIGDVQIMLQLLESLGMQIDPAGPSSWRLQASQVGEAQLDPELCRRIRASILLAGPMLNRSGALRLPPPGGDVIGRRRVDTHFLALGALGAQIDFKDRLFHLRAKKRLRGAGILLDEASVTASENAIMAAVLAEGITTIRNAASEPHVQELCHFLNRLGARIENIGSNTLRIEGVERLHGGEFTIGPDYLEVVSLIAAGVITGGRIGIQDAGVEHLDMIRLVFKRLGVTWQEREGDIQVQPHGSIEIEPDLGGFIPEITVMPWPAFPTDLVSIAIVLASQARGSVLFHDWMYPSRMFFVDKLVSMGARIILCDPHRCIVEGPTPLSGEFLESPDIRAGMALVLAALAAKGTSVIRNINQIERGYERIDEKLRQLGASIERSEE